MANIFIKTFGCDLNKADSETMAGILASEGHKITDNYNNAHVLIINTCTSSNKDDKEFFEFFEEMKKQGKNMIIAGCIPQTDPARIKGYSQIGVSQIQEINTIVEETLHGETITLVARGETTLKNPVKRKNSQVGIIPINEGCMKSCKFCISQESRGGLRSHDPAEIIERAQDALKEGAKQIWLTSLDAASYGRDINQDLPSLVYKLAGIHHNFRIRLGTLNPGSCLHIKEGLTEALKNEKAFKYLHFPIQSGSNEMLKSMNRDYTIEEAMHLINEIKNAIPDITIETDVICGYPGETKDHFLETAEKIKQMQPDKLNVYVYSKRKNMTPEEDSHRAKERARFLSEMHAWIERKQNKKMIGKICEAVIEDIGKDNTFIGRTSNFKKIVLKNNGRFAKGDLIRAHITGVQDDWLKAEFKGYC